MQFDMKMYMDPTEEAKRKELTFEEFVSELRSIHSHKPGTGFKGVHPRGNKFEARNSPHPVRHC